MHAHCPPPSDLARLCARLQSACGLPVDGLLGTIATEIAHAIPDPVNALDAAHAASPRDSGTRRGGYFRHVAYADPLGHFTIVYLVWPPQQFSPVHGHRTWCAYRVLQGQLTETLYRWDEDAQCAYPLRHAQRLPGDIVTAHAGLEQIHRLGNKGPDLAVSLHVYGVDAQAIATGVNHLVATAPDDTALTGVRRDPVPVLTPSTG